jgi:hypothetical protein
MPRPAPFLVQFGPSHGTAARPGLVGAGVASFALCSLLAAHPARAAAPQVVELNYDQPAELSDCPDEETFQRAVTDRLGRDPFVQGAPRKISVLFSRTGATLTALVRVEEAGRARGERRIETRSGCSELASGAALAVSIAIDPLAALGAPLQTEDAHPDPAEKAGHEPASTTVDEHPKPTDTVAGPPAKPSPTRDSGPVVSRAFARAGMRAWAGITPAISTGPSIGFGYQHGFGSLALDAIAVLPRSESVPGTRRAVAVALLGAQLSPCAHFAELRGCALFDSGALFAHGEGVADPLTATSFYASAGIGFGYSFFAGRFSLTPIIEASAHLTTAQLSLDGQLVWSTPRLLGSLGLEVGYDVSR